jgi:diaminohydroxyphosphoribosylaminopyrimidine deaminase/5-amino-6-(5-phosphoribosylamino)uracil reductase
MDWKREITAVGQQLIINNEKVNEEVHKWRSHEQAILIGTNTALLDNPRLNVRLTEGQNPIRVVIDRSLQIPSHYRLMDASIPTFVFTDREMPDSLNKEYISIPRSIPVIEFILSELYKRNIQSLLVEGGAKLLNSFIQKSLWDEARVISSLMTIEDGVKSPVLENNQPVSVTGMDNNNISFYFNKNSTPFIPIF